MTIDRRINKIRQQLKHKEDMVYILDLLDDGTYLDISTGIIYENVNQLYSPSVIIIDDIKC